MHVERIDGERVFLVHGFFTPEECAEAIARSETEGYVEAPITTKQGAQMRKDIRNNTRLMIEDEELAQALFERAEPFLPSPLDGWNVFGFNERFRYYRYDAGETFRPHFDGSYRRSEEERSLVTFMIYLNEDFGGGETVFYDSHGHERERVVPERGAALVFIHAQLHEGAPVTSGRKYVLRTDVMYRHTP